MKIVAAVVMGFFSGCLVYYMAGNSLSPAVGVVLLVSGWAVSSYFLLRGAQTASKVLSRGFLLGTTQWLLFIAAMIVYTILATAPRAEAVVVRVIIALFMAVVCFFGFAVVHFWKREIKPEIEKGGQ